MKIKKVLSVVLCAVNFVSVLSFTSFSVSSETDDLIEEPTYEATDEPTEEPTDEPTEEPTEETTEKPTEKPTYERVIWDGSSDTDWYNDEETELHISTAKELAGLAELVNSGKTMEGQTIYLDNDIYLNDISDKYPTSINYWTGIGIKVTNPDNDISKDMYFMGTFDGNNHSIKGLAISMNNGLDIYTKNIYAGLFGLVGENGAVINLSCDPGGSTSTSNKTDPLSYIGGICAINYGTISNCNSNAYISTGISFDYLGDCFDEYSGPHNYFDEKVDPGLPRLGGICGSNIGIISNCNSNGSISSSWSIVGGICGTNDGTISNCNFIGDCKDNNWKAGGICGNNDGTISNCAVNGSINAIAFAGGIAAKGGIIENCLNNSNIQVDSHSNRMLCSVAGGICGKNGTISHCSNSGNVTAAGIASSTAGGICGLHGTISYCSNSGYIIAGEKDYEYSDYSSVAGGICGSGYEAITNCSNIGTVHAASALIRYAGGICGSTEEGYDLRIENCYNQGSIITKYGISGGIVGDVQSSLSMENIYNTGNISGGISRTGGLFGYAEEDNYVKYLPVITNCYYLDSTASATGGNVSDSLLSISKTKTDMMNNKRFANLLGDAFIYVKGDYPKLVFEYGDVNKDSELTVADLVMLQKWLLCEEEPTNWKVGDLCKDNIINIFDVYFLRKILIEIS